MAKSLGADLVSGFFSEGSFDPRELGYTGKIIPLGKPVFAKGLRHEVLRWRFLHRTEFLAEYDTVILSGNCLEAAEKLPRKIRKIYYCHTPPRYIFDLRAQYLARIPRFLHSIANMILDRKAEKYKKLLGNMDVIITNSETVQKRLQDFTGYESEIIYPPTDTSRFTPALESGVSLLEFKDYFLSWARLSPPKRVDLIVDAFLEMPEENLIFTYGKNDPMKDEIIAKIRNSKNITAIESPDDDTLISLIQ
jgi:glycosyltransferase involved in cell wall biosynthesis